VAVVTVNRPKVLNALNLKTVEEIECAFFELKSDASIKAVILTGAGEKAFIAGADINEIATLDATAGAEFAHRGQAVLSQIENLGKPVIAALGGYTLGGGLEIAMACHMRIASQKARVGQPEIGLGIIPGFGGTQRPARLVGEAKAMELVLVGDPIGAEESLRIGLVNQVVAPEELMPAARALADKICSKSAVAVRYAMQSIHRGLQGTIEEGLNLEANLLRAAGFVLLICRGLSCVHFPDRRCEWHIFKQPTYRLEMSR
jgi:enoyl-CoA hydratase